MKKSMFGNLTQLGTKGVLAVSIAMAALFLSACEVNSPQQGDQSLMTQPNGFNGTSLGLTSAVPLGSASTFAVLGGTTVTNDGPSLITGDVGVSPGTALTGFQPEPINSISGPGTVTAGLGVVLGTIYAGGPVAAQAHNDATFAYNYLVGQVPDTIYSGVTQLDGMTFTPGVYSFAPSANLQVNGTVYLDFQGNSDALFIFQLGSTLVTMAGSNVVALNSNTQDCLGANVFWAVGSSATIDGAQFIGTVIAYTTITMTSGANVSGRMLALGGAVTMISDTIAVCGSSDGGTNPPSQPCRDFVTGGGWIKGSFSKNKATFGVSGGIKNGEFWGQLSYNDHKGLRVKSTSVTGYTYIDPVTRQIDGVAKVNGKGSFTYKVIVVDNGEPGRNDSFSIELSNGYSASGDLRGGNIQLHRKCDDDKNGRGGRHDRDRKEKYEDDDERDGHKNCDRDDDDDDDDDRKKGKGKSKR
ncbi:MAG: ice-binding family protein [Bacteroidota bacterium]